MRAKTRLYAIAAVVLMLAPSVLPAAVAASSGGGDGGEGDEDATLEWHVRKKGKLPMALYRSSAVWTGDRAYIFSGRVYEGMVQTILEFAPSTGVIVEKGARVPTGRIMSTAAWLPPYAYIFGGQNLTILDEVLRYHPATDSIEVLPYRLPEPRMGASAVAVDGAIYVIGGRNETEHIAEVLRFHPLNGTFEVMPDMPVQGGGRAAMTDGDHIYLFGGCGSTGNDTVFILDADTGTSEMLDIDLGYGYYWATGAWTGTSALIFGGNDFTRTIGHFLEFTPDAKGGGDLRRIGGLPHPIELAVSFFDEGTGKAYLLGGRSTEDPSSAIYVIKLEDAGSGVEVTATGVAAVVVIMAFTITVVLIQDHIRAKGRTSRPPRGEASRRETEKGAENGRGPKRKEGL